jgi:hypothetical protein
MGDQRLRLVQANQQQGRQNEMFNEMLRGYATMLLAAGRDRGSVGKLLQMLRGFVVWADAWPWEWTAQDVDEWSTDMRDRGLALSTLRSRQGVVRRFCEYAVNPQYPWLGRCQEEFGQIAEQVCHEWNTARHIEEYDHRPERREISRDELRTLFNHVDDRVEQMVDANHKSAAIAWRDATGSTRPTASTQTTGDESCATKTPRIWPSSTRDSNQRTTMTTMIPKTCSKNSASSNGGPAEFRAGVESAVSPGEVWWPGAAIWSMREGGEAVP